MTRRFYYNYGDSPSPAESPEDPGFYDPSFEAQRRAEEQGFEVTGGDASPIPELESLGLLLDLLPEGEFADTVSWMLAQGLGEEPEPEGPLGLYPTLSSGGTFGFAGFDLEDLDDMPFFPGMERGAYGAHLDKYGANLETGFDFFIDGDQVKMWDQFSPEMREMYERNMVAAGLLNKDGYIPGDFGLAQHNAWASVLAMANYYGVTPNTALNRMVQIGGRRRAGAGRGRGPSTAYTIPDYESIAQQSKDLFRARFGHRDPEDWELAMVADYMQQQYQSAGKAQVQARLAGNGEFEIPDPTLKTKAYIENTWENELSRLEDIESTSRSHNVLMNAVTGGARLMGAAQ